MLLLLELGKHYRFLIPIPTNDSPYVGLPLWTIPTLASNDDRSRACGLLRHGDYIFVVEKTLDRSGSTSWKVMTSRQEMGWLEIYKDLLWKRSYQHWFKEITLDSNKNDDDND